MGTRKVVINACYGGFGLSPEATLRMYELDPKSVEKYALEDYYGEKYLEDKDSPIGYGKALEEWREFCKNPHRERSSIWVTVFTEDEKHVLNSRDSDRDNPILVQVVEELRERAYGACAQLKVVEIPDDVEWEIQEYDGSEHIAEKHRTWY